MITHLENIFRTRCVNNQQYSLRAFAKSLDIPVSTLSELMSGKRSLTKKLSLRIGKSLRLSEEQVEAFSFKPHGNSKIKKAEDLASVHYKQLTLDSFFIVSEWQHYGILQLLKTKKFKNDPVWISRRLKITSEQAESALKRLIRIGFIEIEANGKLRDVTGGSTSHLQNNFTNEQLRQFQVTALHKAAESIQVTSIELRDNTSMTLALNKKAISLAKKEITTFRRRLTKILEEYDEPDEVYQLAISLTPLTEIEI